ncbi:hypothetical protein FOIG_14844 [Fusarium odoratissimum NRRL 54006]|uniref:Secreted protein n=1 Tax=Fusarium odoratissimum (strain NRRL 54006) TaxID=1089451 RepID=X0K1T8_FUSO5|nr:uncharacterized protein FOIG_15711 [Fusarium odoratissimum NRRL 54006]XP_031054050.1 uncharacterized protein FOIG_14844 [Fusarium odoratissimum NRRL 54006]EXL91029.1 hypothetical protein FOIG_15711 [Fusarium odoratissimum NRRL 54006]EXL91960.1 hypothetical protein FOIG_14844 [Fusarium odoratissimum NRRL 54006]
MRWTFLTSLSGRMMSQAASLALSGPFPTVSRCGSGFPRSSASTTHTTPTASSFRYSRQQDRLALVLSSMRLSV